jgi:ABC-2 type transport system ATP-binding protein
VATAARVDDLRASAVRRLDLTFGTAPPRSLFDGIPGIGDVSWSGAAVHLTVTGSTAALFSRAAPLGLENVVTHEPDLEDLFLSLYARDGSP